MRDLTMEELNLFEALKQAEEWSHRSKAKQQTNSTPKKKKRKK